MPGPDWAETHALIARGMMAAHPGETPSSCVAVRLAEHVGAAGLWSELAVRPFRLDALDPDSVAESVLRTIYGRASLTHHGMQRRVSIALPSVA